jgi:hypothetical protein
LMFLHSSATRPRRTLRLLSCHRSVGWPPLPGLTAKRARKFDIPLRTAKLLITASAPMISARTDCRLEPWLLLASRLQDQSNAFLLEPDRGSARRPICHSAALASQGTSHSTTRALDHRASALVLTEQHVDRASVFRTRHRSRRNTRLSACQGSARYPSRRSFAPRLRTWYRADPTSHDKPRSRNKPGRHSTLSCNAG